MMPNVRRILDSVRSLLGGTAAFMVGNSLLSVVLPLRMKAAGYPVALTGAIMAAYYFGLALGGLRSKRVIFRIGHIRAFAVFAALTASTILAYAAFFDPIAWRVLSFYMVTFFLATALGQNLVNLADVAAPDLFMLAASLIMLALIPVAMTKLYELNLSDSRVLNVRPLFAAFKVGVVGAGVAGLMVTPSMRWVSFLRSRSD